ncbi:MAG: fimbrillin family protein [Prevotella sp.]|nr:fimbrillin family protein [Prevotella sp.]
MNKIYNTSHVLLLTAILLLAAACSSDSSNDVQPSPNTPNTSQEISLIPTVWQMMEGTRAAFYEGGNITSSFTVAAYSANTTTAYISPVAVNYVTDKWSFSDGKHYWPASGNLDFFAYMPAEKPNYITSEPTYSVQSSTPQASFTCANIPMTYNATDPTAGQGSSLQEFIWGITIGQNKTNQGESGVTMKFRHPFARLRFQLAASHPDIIINSITFKNLKTGGTCTLNNTDIDATYYYKTSEWSDLTGSSNLVMTLAGKDSDGNWIAASVNTFNSNPSSVVPIGGWGGEPATHQYIDLLVIPQTFAGEIEVNAGWNDWGDTPVAHTVSKTISAITWQPGKTYTYTLTISTDDLTVDINSYTEQW